ncbi:MAG TPA: mechanosensitive ion channel family protein [Chthoniobacteraceae bacterium]|jgi:small-conductance mechanosensitive channel/CRP-like cAMP-binding protein|nr:mechanosensitive ion channel family protein [Chthoniobacteraceae bacterium]
MFAELPPLETILIEGASIPVIFIVLIALGRWLKRRQRVNLGTLYVLFSLAFSIWIPLLFTHLDMPWKSAVVMHASAAVLLLGTLFALALVRRYFWEGWFERHNQTKAPKFLSELVALVVFVVAALVVLGGIYGKSIQGAIFGSTVVLGVLGFAMQDLLGNIISGIALEIGKPFKPGDWLIVEGRRAEVIEVNWRSTRLRNNDDVYIDIPNKSIAGSIIVNLTYPTREHAVRLVIGFDYTVPPNFVKDCLVRATVHAVGVLPMPAPKAFLKDFADSAILYEIKFYLEDESRYNSIIDSIRTNVWYEAQRRGIRIPYPIRTVQIERTRPAAAPTGEAMRGSTGKQPFLELLDKAQSDRLMRSAQLLRFGRGERVIEQGEEGVSMFILLRGEAAVVLSANGSETRVATLREGDYFGEMSLLTGEPRSATVVAQTDCELWEIGKEVIGQLLEENQILVEKLSDLLAKRRMENEGLLANTQAPAAVQDKHREYRAGFLTKLKAFFEL